MRRTLGIIVFWAVVAILAIWGAIMPCKEMEDDEDDE